MLKHDSIIYVSFSLTKMGTVGYFEKQLFESFLMKNVYVVYNPASNTFAVAGD